MSLEAQPLEIKTDWDILEAQFSDGGDGGNYDDGDDDDRWDDDDEDDDDDEMDLSKIWIAGGATGLMAGMASGVWLTNRADQIMIGKPVVASVPPTRPTVEQGHYNAINENVDLATTFGPIFVLTAIGLIVGKKIQNKLIREQDA